MNTATTTKPMSPAPDIDDAVEAAASLMLDYGLVERWVEGAIYPCELAFFIGTCLTRQVRVVVESGRQDGYSTEILGRFAQRHDVDVVSVDMEIEPHRARECRGRLQGLPVELLVGDAYDLVGRKIDTLADTTALLVDGPKGWAALSMIAAALRPHVAVFALHNLIGAQLDWVVSIGGRRYEDCGIAGGPAWRELCRSEARHVKSAVNRSNTPSTLGVVAVDEPQRLRIARSYRPEFGFHQPEIVRLLWRLGLYRLTPKLYHISHRILRR
jgi:hypothetical protein